MHGRRRIVVDTNVMVSRMLLADSVPARAVQRAKDEGTLLVSDATLVELAEVLSRVKLDRYVSLEERRQFLRELSQIAEFVSIVHPIRECRDPKDDKFLEVALNGRADAIVTGDADLLRMGPWRGIEIVSPAEFLEK
jgi:uncharacterized protein